MLGLCSVLENPGPSRPAPRDGSGENDPSLPSAAKFTVMHNSVLTEDVVISRAQAEEIADEATRLHYASRRRGGRTAARSTHAAA